jgi:hypothetical protein
MAPHDARSTELQTDRLQQDDAPAEVVEAVRRALANPRRTRR